MLLSKLFLFIVLLLDGNVVHWTASFLNGWHNQVHVAQTHSLAQFRTLYTAHHPAQKDFLKTKHMGMKESFIKEYLDFQNSPMDVGVLTTT